jgi:hypothetical protein
MSMITTTVLVSMLQHVVGRYSINIGVRYNSADDRG